MKKLNYKEGYTVCNEGSNHGKNNPGHSSKPAPYPHDHTVPR